MRPGSGGNGAAAEPAVSNRSGVAIDLEDAMRAFALVVSGWLVAAPVASPPSSVAPAPGPP